MSIRIGPRTLHFLAGVTMHYVHTFFIHECDRSTHRDPHLGTSPPPPCRHKMRCLIKGLHCDGWGGGGGGVEGFIIHDDPKWLLRVDCIKRHEQVLRHSPHISEDKLCATLTQ